MPAILREERIIRFKIVYCGTPLCGKTESFRQIHSRLDPSGRGELLSLSTRNDRTVFFDFLSVDSEALPGYKTSFQLYTVPGQVTYNATYQLVLQQADGVVFVADSQLDRQRDNVSALQNLEANLRLNEQDPEEIPIVLQYNKRDLPNAAPVEYLEFLLNNQANRRLSFETSAANGQNILATLQAVCQLALERFHEADEAEEPPPDEPAMATKED
jgi:signal recognition particle receptor subunit beta